MALFADHARMPVFGKAKRHSASCPLGLVGYGPPPIVVLLFHEEKLRHAAGIHANGFEARLSHARVVEHEQASRGEIVGKSGYIIVVASTVRSVENKEAGVFAPVGRPLGNELLGQIKREILGLHVSFRPVSSRDGRVQEGSPSVRGAFA